MTYCQLDPNGTHFSEISIKISDICSQEMHFVSASMCLEIIELQWDSNHIILTHWCWNKMAASFQTAFSNSVSSVKIVFWFKFHCNMFPGVQLTISQYWSRCWLGAKQVHLMQLWHIIWLHILPETLWVRILYSAEEDNLSPFDLKIACLCQSFEINNNKHIYAPLDLNV